MRRSRRDDPTPNRVREAIEDAEIAPEFFFESLVDIGGIGDVSVEDGTATVTVTVPIPSRPFRTHVEQDIAEAAGEVEEVTKVACRFEPRAPDSGALVDFIPDVKNVIAVASGKGGVGKSTVAVNLAAALANADASVGLLDADVYGPNAPAMFGLEDRTPDATLEDQIVPREAHDVKMMSMEFIVGEDDPVIWRGPMVDEFIKQLFSDVEWGALDYLIVDLPPGTGDAQLSLVQHLPVTGAVIVTTPSSVALDDARRGLRGFARYDVPILGIVENMSRFECPDCESTSALFGTRRGEELSNEFNVPLLGTIPLDPSVGRFEIDDDGAEPPGITIPGLGRLQLPRTQAEREGRATASPIAVRNDGGEARDVFERLSARTAARVNALAATTADMGTDTA
jgi:ATP-binding protein involved in chromosome partitioning